MAKLLKLWTNWEDGMGYPVDDGTHNGFCGLHTEYEQSFYGLKSELRVAQQGQLAASFGRTVNFAFDTADPTSGRNVYFIGSGASAYLSKVRVYINSSTVTFTDNGDVNYAGTQPFGQPAQYLGNWYWSIPNTLTSVIYKLTTSVTGALSSDTIDTGDASSGGGHMAIVGHQLGKFSNGSGVSLLTTAAAATTNANWGSYFPVGDSSYTAIGLASLEGLSFALRDNGLWTFNDRGRAAQLYTTGVSPWLNSIYGICRSITSWKGGLVYIGTEGSLWYYTPNNGPVDIGLTHRPDFFLEPISPIQHNSFDNSLHYRSISTVGEYIYAFVTGNGGSNGNSYILVGQARGGDPTQIVWNQLAYHDAMIRQATMIPVYGLSSTWNTGVLLYSDNTDIYYQHIHPNGSPLVTNVDEGTALVLAPSEANVYMSEIRFAPSERPRFLLVYPKGLIAGDVFQMRAFINGQSVINLGAPISSNRPFKVMLPEIGEVFSIMVGIDFDTSDTTTKRAALPAIYRMELWGDD